MKRLGVKLKVFLVTIISALLIATAFLCLSPLFNNKAKKKETNALGYLDSQAYLIDNANLLANNYDKYTYFRIGSNASGTITPQKGFEALTLFLQKAPSTGKYFSGKTIYMQASVTSTTFALPRFDGTLDGQGHSIFFDGTYTTSGSGDFSAFIGTNNGTIKNLKITGVDVFVSYVFLGAESRVSAFIGTNNGTIDGCIVDNCTFKSDRAKTNCTVTTFCVANNGTISNCMVTGTLALKLQGWDKGIKSYYFVITGNEATNSIWAATCSEDSSQDSSKCDTPSENGDTALNSGKGNFSSCANAHSNMPSTYISTSAGSSGTVFYKYATTEYGYGKDSKYCVYLRAFISSWTSYTFASANTSQGTVDTSSLMVPTEYASVSKAGRTLKIYSSTITAIPVQGYMFSSWTNSGNAYTANFTEGYYYFEFSALKIGNQTINPVICNSAGTTVTQPIKVGVGTQTTVECIHTATQTTIIYYYDNYQTSYTITDVKYTLDKSGTYSFLIWDDDEDVTAVPIEEFGDYLTTRWFGYGKIFTFTAPTVKLKTYNTNFS